MANGLPDQPANAPTPTSSPAAQSQPPASPPATAAQPSAQAAPKAPAATAAQAVSGAPQNPAGAGRPGSSVIAAPVQDDDAEWPRYKVEPPASGFRWHGIDVGADFTPVPPDRTGPLLSAAAAVGVTLTAEG